MAGKCPHSLRERFVQDTFRLTTSELARRYDRAPSTIREWRIQLQREGEEVGYGYPTSQTPEWNEYEEISGDAIIISDLEIPDHDAETLDLATSVAIRYKIDTLIIAGDFMAHDAFSTHAETWVAPSQRDYQAEGKIANKVLKRALEHFQRIIVITGNHDARLAYITRGYITLDAVLRKRDNITISWYRYCYLTSSGNRFLVVHPVNYSKRPLVVPSDLSVLEEPRCGVISAHTHHLACGWEPTGRYQIAETGCCRSLSRTRYKREKKTKYPEWINGFVMVRAGRVYALATRGTDWDFWLGEKRKRKRKKKRKRHHR